MSRTLVDAVELERFLERLSRCYRYAGKLYLVGGSSLLLITAKTSTYDIDLHLDVPHEHHDEMIRCLREVSREMRVSVELASSEHSIPLPHGHVERHQFIGRYGSIKVFHFDFYSVALSKIHRGNEEDYADVINMVRQGAIDVVSLERRLREILPRLEFFSPTADPADFRRKFALFQERLQKTQR